MRIRISPCVDACSIGGVPKTIQIRDIDDDVYAALVRRSAEAGITVPELLRREAARLAARPTVAEWLARTRRRPSALTAADVLEALDEQRGLWPDAGG
jgi:antitoxin FitA